MTHHGAAPAAESRRDFVHKMKIAHKELCETQRWLRLAMLVPLLEERAEGEMLIAENGELIRIFAASIRTAKGTDSGDPGHA